jgi:hypothetical protein
MLPPIPPSPPFGIASYFSRYCQGRLSRYSVRSDCSSGALLQSIPQFLYPGDLSPLLQAPGRNADVDSCESQRLPFLGI